ncbi:probable sphingolipid transporter spinster homolog 2 isoform X3 [Diospyros lotus]|uniref:probable sphingolipid transporter spinster homolog 2 isoform X3 n=1 Tax=Diospyros lotus TaxID=55363 RepID=UPI0022569DAF|nr:probable sphingolipid transporter spinster homolog 2 isoform X3 [Diospyros lotus]
MAEEARPKSEVAVTAETTDMGRISNAFSPPKPSWFTPKRLLIIFCVINLLNYLDRGAIASNGVNGNRRTCTKSGTCTSGSGIQGDFNLNNFQDGVLSSAFMVGLLVASPIFASLAKRLVGVGEASFISLAAPFIDDNAPVTQKTAWLAIFYMCIPAGVALGYVYGGFVGGHFNWRFAFFGEAILMFPFAVLGFVMKPLQLKGFTPAESKKALTGIEGAVSEVKDDSTSKVDMLSIKVEVTDQSLKGPSKSRCRYVNLDQLSRFLKDMKVLLLEKVYVVNVLGYISYNFVIGAYSYWGPKAGYNIYSMRNADMVFGGITIVCGILGTIAGGLVLDKMNSTISNAFKLLSAATFLGAAFCFSAFCLKSLYAFLVLFSIGELLVFATQGPVNYICLHCVNPSMRPLSMAMSTVAIHIFGDVPSSPLVGVLQDNVNNWRVTALVLTTVLFLAAAIWFIGIFIHSVDRFNEDSEHPVTTTEKTNTMPLLEGKTAGETEHCGA